MVVFPCICFSLCVDISMFCGESPPRQSYQQTKSIMQTRLQENRLWQERFLCLRKPKINFTFQIKIFDLFRGDRQGIRSLQGFQERFCSLLRGF